MSTSIIGSGKCGITFNEKATLTKALKDDNKLIADIAKCLGGYDSPRFKEWLAKNKKAIHDGQKKIRSEIRKCKRNQKCKNK